MKKKNLLLVAASILLLGACKKDDAPAASRYQLTDASTAIWKGYLRNGYFNEGTLRVESQDIGMSDGKVESGTFQMPLSALVNVNLPTAELKQELIHHLQSADFFNMALHPNVSFKISSVTDYQGKPADAIAGANQTVAGKLSILGRPMEISFPARVNTAGDSLFVAAILKVDRTRWGMTYAADPSLPDDKHILPEMAIELNLKGVRK